jgi:hypothetical protein
VRFDFERVCPAEPVDHLHLLGVQIAILEADLGIVVDRNAHGRDSLPRPVVVGIVEIAVVVRRSEVDARYVIGIDPSTPRADTGRKANAFVATDVEHGVSHHRDDL